MMNVRVQIEKINYDKTFEFDNVVSRDEVVHKVLSQSKEMRVMYKETNELKDNDIYITWSDPSMKKTEPVSQAKETTAKTEVSRETDEVKETDAG